MLPGWMMPIDQLIEIVTTTPSREAGRMLAVLPRERFDPVVAGMAFADFIRIVVAAKPEDQAEILAMLPRDRIPSLLRSVRQEEAAQLFAALSVTRMLKVANDLHPMEIAMLLEAMPPARRAALLEAMGPERALEFQAMMYERQIARSFSRTSVNVMTPEGGPSGILLAEAFNRNILISVHFLDRHFTLKDLREAEDAARTWRAHALLAVTNLGLAHEVYARLDEVHRQGWPMDVVTWTDSGHDGALLRTLVGLIR